MTQPSSRVPKPTPRALSLIAGIAILIGGFGLLRALMGWAVLPKLENSEIAGMLVGMASALLVWVGIWKWKSRS
jgi:hypothetical protein